MDGHPKFAYFAERRGILLLSVVVVGLLLALAVLPMPIRGDGANFAAVVEDDSTYKWDAYVVDIVARDAHDSVVYTYSEDVADGTVGKTLPYGTVIDQIEVTTYASNLVLYDVDNEEPQHMLVEIYVDYDDPAQTDHWLTKYTPRQEDAVVNHYHANEGVYATYVFDTVVSEQLLDHKVTFRVQYQILSVFSAVIG